MSLFSEDNIFSFTTNLTYGPQSCIKHTIKNNKNNNIYTMYIRKENIFKTSEEPSLIN